MKKGFKDNIITLGLANTNFREVLYTAKHCQLVASSLLPGEAVGTEIHENGDQFVSIVMGEGEVHVNKLEYVVGEGDVFIIPEGAMHNIINTSKVLSLKFYAIYAPPEHQDKVVRATKSEAEEGSPEFDGTLSEY